jgi:nickel-dependent lactate racemase
MSVIGGGKCGETISDEQVRQIIAGAAGQLQPAGKRVLVVIPDYTRTCPLPLIARELHAAIAPQAEALDFLIALGTHPPMSEEAIDTLLDIPAGRRGEVLPGSKVFNHEWDNPDALKKVGTFTAEQVAGYLSPENARFARDIDVTINKRIFDYDIVMIAGPVFPHEVVGFSGGAKYFFPGICGPELLNFFHWLGALITIPRMIGVKDTPVRAMLHAAADMIDVQTCALCMVVKGNDLSGLYFGSVREAWGAAADLSDKELIIYCDRPYQSILSRAPEMYDELWTGGKCMYKMECVVADGGELIIYAPHIKEIAVAHEKIIEEIGYHPLPYFTSQWERFKDYPWGILAHSTHVRGIGTYENGVEQPRVKVTLATGIPEELCRKINMGYRDPAGIDISEWQGKEDEGKLYVPKAGEMLYRLADPPEWQRCDL